MKYIITDENEIRIGNGYHFELAQGCKGKVIKAGHCLQNKDGTYKVWGGSIGFNINSKQEDAELLNKK